MPGRPEIVRFGDFELDVAGCDLRRLGRRVKLGRQSMDVLILLVQRRRELVLRSEIVDRLWGKDVFVDVETGVNTAISKIRQALRDSADAPRFIETVPARGYRFVAPVDIVGTIDETAASAQPPGLGPVSADTASGDSTHRASYTDKRSRLFAGVAVVAIIAGAFLWMQRERGSPGRVTLAVLPFENVGGDPAREYLAAGLTEETSASIAQIDPERLSVKGRVWGYKGTTKTAAEIGRELSVEYLVESTIRSEGGRVRVTVTLIRARDQEHVWSQSYEREPTSLLGLEQELSTAIAEQIQGRLSPALPRSARQTQNAQAYDAYLKGRYLQSRRTPATNRAAIELYERATSLDSQYALAWSSLAFTYAGSTINGDARPLDVRDLARRAADRAVQANPNLAEAQFAAAYVDWLIDWDWRAAETAFRASIRLDPSNAVAHRTLGHALSQLGRQTEAAVEMRRTRDLEPLEPMSYALSAQVAFQARDYASAIEYARHAVLIDSELWVGYSELAQAYEQDGHPDLAMAALTDASRFSASNSKAVSLKGYLLARTGHETEARAVLSQLEADSRVRYVPPYAMALVLAGLGESTQMFERLDQAYAARDVHLIYLPVDPKWDPYRADPRFAAVLRRCGFPTSAARP